MPTTSTEMGGNFLTDEIKAQMREYIENCPNKVPSISGLAKYIGFNRHTLYNWAKTRKEVAKILEDIQTFQEVELIDKGLGNEFNPAITKMLLARHGYADKVETDVTSGGQQLNAWTVQPVTTNTDE